MAEINLLNNTITDGLSPNPCIRKADALVR